MSVQVSDTKSCSRCGIAKPLDGFVRKKAGSGYRRMPCKVCRSELRKAWGPQERARHRDYIRKGLYGLRLGEYAEMVARQDNRCAVCGRGPEATKRGTFCVDHDHVTGRVRGLLCNRCNAMLVLLDDPALRTAALKYLGLLSPERDGVL